MYQQPCPAWISTMAVVYVPSLLRGLTEGKDRVSVSGLTLRQVINNLDAAYPGMKERLTSGDDLSPAISVAVDGEVVRVGLLQSLAEDSEVHFLPAISGGGGRE